LRELEPHHATLGVAGKRSHSAVDVRTAAATAVHPRIAVHLYNVEADRESG